MIDLKKENDKLHIIFKLTLAECEKLDILDELIKELEFAYKEEYDRNKLIYLDKKVKGFNNTKMDLKWGISKRQINRIIKEVEEKI